MTKIYTTPPTEEDILALAEAAFAALPESLSRHARGVMLVVEDLADEKTLEALGLENPWELTGLYRGIPLTQRSVSDPVQFPDAVILYRDAILGRMDRQRRRPHTPRHQRSRPRDRPPFPATSDADIERIEADLAGG